MLRAERTPHSELLARAAREPLGVDISDYSDEWCAGFLAGQENGVRHLEEQLESAEYQGFSAEHWHDEYVAACKSLSKRVQQGAEAVRELRSTKEQYQAAVVALREADRLASVAHDAIWDKTVEPTQILHDNDYPTSAQAAIWQLHEAVRPLLGDSIPAGEPTPLQRAYGGKVRTVSTEPSNPAKVEGPETYAEADADSFPASRQDS